MSSQPDAVAQSLCYETSKTFLNHWERRFSAVVHLQCTRI